MFWYLYGDLMNKLGRAVPHAGYQALHDIIGLAGKEQKHWIYHSGVDNLYAQAGFTSVMHAKGSLFDWLCPACKTVTPVSAPSTFKIDRIAGAVKRLPLCSECRSVLRPNIQMRGDFDWDDTRFNQEAERMDAWMASPAIHKHSVTILEIGAGPVQPLSRQLADSFLKNDRYRCCLIRINPVKERLGQYKHERAEFKRIAQDRRQVAPDGLVSVREPVLAGHIPDMLADDTRHLVMEEDKEYAGLKNEIIEIQLGAEEALLQIRNYLS